MSIMCPYCGDTEQIEDIESGDNGILFKCHYCGNEFYYKVE